MTSLPMSVSGSLLGPVMEHFQTMAETADIEALQKLVNQIPDLYDAMDHDALAATLERAMGAAAIYGAMNSKGADLLTGLASDDYETGVAFMPFEAAAAALDRKTPIGSKLNSLQWQGVPAELRSRAMFSSRVEAASFLTEARDRLSSELRLQREQLANGKQAFFSRNDFIIEMRRLAEAEGIDTTNGTFDGSIRDIRSSQRLGLIYDINTEQAENYGRYKMDLDPDVFDAYPAKRLVRVEDREHKRNWIEIWRGAAAEVGWVGVHRGSDMVALKTSEIWTNLGPFGNPYPPYDWGSGMGDEDVDREEAERLGLVKPLVPAAPPEKLQGFNAALEASTTEIDPKLILKMVKIFGSKIEVIGKAVKWIGSLP